MLPRRFPVRAAAVLAILLGSFARPAMAARPRAAPRPRAHAAIDSLAITITGLPDTISASVTVTGPGGFSRLFTSSGTLTELAPGEYTVTAARVTAFGFPLDPTPVTQVVTVPATGTATAAVVYAPPARVLPPPDALLPGFHDRQAMVKGTMHKYLLYVPAGYTPSRAWPVILFLHGTGDAGAMNNVNVLGGLGDYVKENLATFPAIVVFPEIPITIANGSTVSVGHTTQDMVALSALDHALAEVHGDSSRIYVTGLSFGAIRSWDLVYARPDFFAASVPIAGALCGQCITVGGTDSRPMGVVVAAERLAKLPIWVFHGDQDPNVPVAADRTLVQRLRAAGSPVKYTEYAGAGHDVWTRTYHDPALWEWLFAQHR